MSHTHEMMLSFVLGVLIGAPCLELGIKFCRNVRRRMKANRGA